VRPIRAFVVLLALSLATSPVLIARCVVACESSRATERATPLCHTQARGAATLDLAAPHDGCGHALIGADVAVGASGTSRLDLVAVQTAMPLAALVRGRGEPVNGTVRVRPFAPPGAPTPLRI
jgi:hypothetical protein